MGAMTASIAHEINQPLGAIVANASAGLRWTAQAPPALDEARECFEQIVREGQRTADVIQSVRAMFKSKELVRVSIDLNQLIHEVLTLVQGTLQKHGIVVRTELDKMLSAVTGNRVQLQQVLFNIVTNAIEAMESVADPTARCWSNPNSKAAARCGSRLKIPAAASTQKISTRSSVHSSQPKPMAWGWVCRFAGRSSNRTAGVCGLRRATPRAQFFSSLCRPVHPGTNRQGAACWLFSSVAIPHVPTLCPLLALNGQSDRACVCPLLE
jgi:hypothetical protein